MRKRTVIIIIGLAIAAFNHDYKYFTLKHMKRVRNKIIEVKYDTVSIMSSDTILFREQYMRKDNDEGEYRIFNRSDFFKECQYYRNQDTLIIDFGITSEFDNEMAFKIKDKDLDFYYFHGGAPSLFHIHENDIDNVDSLSLTIDTTSQNILNVSIGLRYHMLFRYSSDGNFYDRYFTIKGCMSCKELIK